MGDEQMSRNTRRSTVVVVFFVITLAITLLTWGTMAVFGIAGASTDPGAAPPSAATMVLFLLGGFSPSIAGLFMAWRTGGRTAVRDLLRRSVRFRFSGWWYLFIVLVPAVLLAVRVVVYRGQGGEFLESALLASPVSFIPFTVQILLFGPISEEFGWRGFVLEPLTERIGRVAGNLVLGTIWALWHLPLFFIPGTSQQLRGRPGIEFLVFAVGVVAMTFVYTRVYFATGQSLAAVILLHASYNFSVSFLVTIVDEAILGRIIDTVYMAIVAVLVLVISKNSGTASAALETEAASD
jgi:uncharacterized protein